MLVRLFFSIFLFLSLPAFSQKTIKGRVVDDKTKAPIAGSSVFISNTSRGTVSDKDGHFELNDVPTGKYDLVISSIGYETNVFSFSTDELPLQLRIELQVRVRELDNVTVEPSIEEGWDKWGKSFTDNFIGRIPNATKCKIKNYKAIRFRYYRKSNRLIAYSDEPLILENKALGYKITYQLEDFEINFKENTSLFAGYPLFEEMDDTPKSKIVRNRDEAYYGSMSQFMRCVYNNNLIQNGFEVRRMFRRPNLEKQRVKTVYRPTHISISSKGISGTPSAPPPSGGNVSDDSTDYYQRILRQKDYIDTYGKELLTTDSLIIGTEGALKAIYFTDYLFITYKNEFEDITYLQQQGESRRPTFQQSIIWLQNPVAIVVDGNGSYFPPQNVFTMSYWGWSEKMASLLPLDYKPSK